MGLQKTVVINLVGLSQRILGAHTPWLNSQVQKNGFQLIKPQVPAVTCTQQATYITGETPQAHGIVGNGWYFKDECEVKFWRQSNKLVNARKLWEAAKEQDPEFTCANLFWWYNMYSSVDYAVTPRPNYLADGRKIPDIYSHPASLRNHLQQKLGPFPLFHFWGPTTSIKSSKWIADAARLIDQQYHPTLSLIYLPHLDYCLQKFGHDLAAISGDLQEIDTLCGQLAEYYQNKGTQIIVLSEYGITDVHRPIHLNRIFRRNGWLQVREERGRELLDAGASEVFAVADHQIAHVYLRDPSNIDLVRLELQQLEGVDQVWDREIQRQNGLDHPRSGDLVVLAEENSWFTYYYWLEDRKAPDFARTVDIHRKPGYDPVEMFTDPRIKFLKPLVAWKLLKKKMGFRTLMDVIPLDANLIRGSHGVVPRAHEDWPMVIANGLDSGKNITSPEIYSIIWNHLNH
ncbi:MAG: alkaline phosphatase family protein [Cyclobacteriaceae bacterium]|nr:alkaline phosphatase family protein [Cyclobacteriaceae bacterium]